MVNKIYKKKEKKRKTDEDQLIIYKQLANCNLKRSHGKKLINRINVKVAHKFIIIQVL